MPGSVMKKTQRGSKNTAPLRHRVSAKKNAKDEQCGRDIVQHRRVRQVVTRIRVALASEHEDVLDQVAREIIGPLLLWESR